MSTNEPSCSSHNSVSDCPITKDIVSTDLEVIDIEREFERQIVGCSKNGIAKGNDDNFEQSATATKITCFMCSFAHVDVSAVEDHMNCVHFGLNSATISNAPEPSPFSGPICSETYPDTRDLQTHINEKHKDILCPKKVLI